MLARLCKSIWLVALLLATTGSVSADPITVNFAATTFSDIVNSDPAPNDPVTGTLVYEAASPAAPIDSLTSISLAIAGHTYVIGEIGFLNVEGGVFYVGGLIDGVGGSGNFEDDFLLVWDTTLLPLQLLYAAADMSGIWVTNTFSRFEVSAVPEPGTLALVGLALLLIILVSCGRRRQGGLFAAGC